MPKDSGNPNPSYTTPAKPNPAVSDRLYPQPKSLLTRSDRKVTVVEDDYLAENLDDSELDAFQLILNTVANSGVFSMHHEFTLLLTGHVLKLMALCDTGANSRSYLSQEEYDINRSSFEPYFVERRSSARLGDGETIVTSLGRVERVPVSVQFKGVIYEAAISFEIIPMSKSQGLIVGLPDLVLQLWDFFHELWLSLKQSPFNESPYLPENLSTIADTSELYVDHPAGALVAPWPEDFSPEYPEEDAPLPCIFSDAAPRRGPEGVPHHPSRSHQPGVHRSLSGDPHLHEVRSRYPCLPAGEMVRR